MDTLLHDLRYAVRMLRRSSGFAAMAVLTLALGIGATTTIFSVVYAVLLRPLPFGDGDRVVMLRTRGHAGAPGGASFSEFEDWSERSRAFQGMAAYIDRPFNVLGGTEPANVWASQVSEGFFRVLGTRPALGRTFSAEEELPGSERAVVLSHGFWTRWMGSDPNVVGQQLRLDDEIHTIVGVMPRDFRSPTEEVELWVSLERMRARIPRAYDFKLFNVVGKLAPEVPIEEARAEMTAIAAQIAREQPRENEGVTAALIPIREQIVGDVRPALLVLFGAAGFVLLIACLNVANLVLARMRSRTHEFTVRRALGMSAGRLFRQLLSESLLLSALGGSLGILLALWSTELIGSHLPAALLPPGTEIGIDGTVLLFSGGLIVLIAILFGLTPMLRARGLDLSRALREVPRGSTRTFSGRRVRASLVIGEVAVALVLLAGATLLLRSFARIQTVDPGFDVSSTLSLYLLLPESRYPEVHQRRAFLDEAMMRIGAISGVASIGGVSHLPISGLNIVEEFEIEGRGPAAGEIRRASYRTAFGDYFRTMGIPLVQGRLFTSTEQSMDRPVAIINETLARQHFPDENPIGRWIGVEGIFPEEGGFGEMGMHEIVGVVADVRHRSLDAAPQSEIYLPYPRMPWSAFFLVLRSERDDPLGLFEPLRAEIRAIDPDLSIADVMTMEQRLALSVAQPRFNTLLLGSFALLALLLATVGVYGVLSYTVGERTHEIGVRMSLGATHRDVLAMVLKEAVTLAAVGIAIGLVAALALTRLLASLLFEVSPTDPLLLGAVSLLLASVALLAGLVPARRATRVDPMVALRSESDQRL